MGQSQALAVAGSHSTGWGGLLVGGAVGGWGGVGQIRPGGPAEEQDSMEDHEEG